MSYRNVVLKKLEALLFVESILFCVLIYSLYIMNLHAYLAILILDTRSWVRSSLSADFAGERLA